jgi:hypothetical protein
VLCVFCVLFAAATRVKAETQPLPASGVPAIGYPAAALQTFEAEDAGGYAAMPCVCAAIARKVFNDQDNMSSRALDHCWIVASALDMHRRPCSTPATM